MSAVNPMRREAQACAGVVLYKPDPALLARQAEGLRGRTLFPFANGPFEAQALAALAPTDLRLIRSEENVGMGQGRNAVWLATQGWQVTGFDVAGEGLRLAREQAASEGVKIDTVYAADRDFDFGKDRWNLIAFIYSPLRELEAKAFAGLKPGGLVVAEAFGNAGDPARASQGVFYGPGEMRAIFEKAGFKVIRYEEPVDTADYGLDKVPLVRLVAMKPDR